MSENERRVTEADDSRAMIYAIHANTVRQSDWTPLAESMPERMAKAQRFRFEKDRLLCVGAGILMREVVGIRNESELKTGEFGKLSAPGYPSFNLSHSGEWCVLAMGSDDVGIDIERVDPAHLRVASSVYTDAELAWMNESPLERFFLLWTWKESVMKATGAGLSLEPRSFEVLPFCRNAPIRLGGRLLYAGSYGLDGYQCSVCTTHPVARVDWTEWDTLAPPATSSSVL